MLANTTPTAASLCIHISFVGDGEIKTFITSIVRAGAIHAGLAPSACSPGSVVLCPWGGLGRHVGVMSLMHHCIMWPGGSMTTQHHHQHDIITRLLCP